MSRQMEVYFHGEREGALWRGQVIGTATGDVKARVANLYATQQQAAEAASKLWARLQKQLQAVTP